MDGIISTVDLRLHVCACIPHSPTQPFFTPQTVFMHFKELGTVYNVPLRYMYMYMYM